MKYISKFESYKNGYNLLKVKNNNVKYIKKELINSKKLLDNINGYSLDREQRLSIVTDEDNTLVIAGAGSGKTLTIVGKIRYLIEKMNIKQDEILCISFTNDSVNSLKKALQKFYNYNIDVYTFHKLSFNIIKNNNSNVSVCNSDLLIYIIDEFFKRNITDKKLLNTSSYEQLKKLI